MVEGATEGSIDGSDDNGKPVGNIVGRHDWNVLGQLDGLNIGCKVGISVGGDTE